MRSREIIVTCTWQMKWISITIITALMMASPGSTDLSCKISRTTVLEEKPFAVSCIYKYLHSNVETKIVSLSHNENEQLKCTCSGGTTPCKKEPENALELQEHVCDIDHEGDMIELRLLFLKADYFNHNGTYTCDLHGNGPETDNCTVKVKEAEPKSSCETSRVVRLGNEAFVECKFSYNITSHKTDVTVVKESSGLNQKQSTTKTIIDCTWRNGAWLCRPNALWFNATVNDYALKLTTLSVNESLAGTYTCILHTAIPAVQTSCTLKLEAQEDTTQQNTFTVQSSTAQERSAVISLSVVVPILVALIVVGLIYYFCKRSKLSLRGKDKPPKHPDPNADERSLKLEEQHEDLSFPPRSGSSLELQENRLSDEQSRLLQQRTETEESTGSLHLDANTLPNKTIIADTLLTVELDQKGASDASSSHGDLTKGKMSDYEKTPPSTQNNDQDPSWHPDREVA